MIVKITEEQMKILKSALQKSVEEQSNARDQLELSSLPDGEVLKYLDHHKRKWIAGNLFTSDSDSVYVISEVQDWGSNESTDYRPAHYITATLGIFEKKVDALDSLGVKYTIKSTYDIEKIFSFKDVNIYEFTEFFRNDSGKSIVSDPKRGDLIKIKGIEYVIIHAIEERVDWGKDHQTSIRGVYFKLILTDDAKLLKSEKRLQQRRKEENVRVEKKNSETFIAELRAFLEGRDFINVSVIFQQKDNFKQAFSGRTQWNSQEKTWSLKFKDEDFINLTKDTSRSNLNTIVWKSGKLSVYKNSSSGEFLFGFSEF